MISIVFPTDVSAQRREKGPFMNRELIVETRGNKLDVLNEIRSLKLEDYKIEDIILSKINNRNFSKYILVKFSVLGDKNKIHTKKIDRSTKRLKNYLEGLNGVKEVSYNRKFDLHTNDEHYPLLWNLENIGQSYPINSTSFETGSYDSDIDAALAWQNDNSNKGEDIIVAVSDTGLYYEHEDIDDNLWINSSEDINENNRFDNYPVSQGGDLDGIDNDENGYVDDIIGWDVAYNDNNPTDAIGHGTHVSGIIAAEGNNNIGVVGVAYNAKIMTLKGFTGYSGGEYELAETIYYAVDNGADIINMSWGFLTDSPEVNTDTLIYQAIEYARINKVICVTSAGNNNLNAMYDLPSKIDSVIVVSATDSQDERYSNGNFGSKLDVVAPGVNILSLKSTGGGNSYTYDENYYINTGTSMAAPHVSGMAALIKGTYSRYNLNDIKQLLRNYSDDIGEDGFDDDFSYGRLNADKIVERLDGKHFPSARLTSFNHLDTINGVIDIEGIFKKYPKSEQQAMNRALSDFIAVDNNLTPRFRWNLSYKNVNEENWHVLINDDYNSNSNNTLYKNFDTTDLENGNYHFRLVVNYDKRAIEIKEVIVENERGRLEEESRGMKETRNDSEGQGVRKKAEGQRDKEEVDKNIKKTIPYDSKEIKKKPLPLRAEVSSN